MHYKKFAKREQVSLINRRPVPLARQRQILAGKPSPRKRLLAKVLIHKNGRYVRGQAVNISRTGMFVETNLGPFRPDETVRLLVRPMESKRSFKLIARVQRFGQGESESQGYGLQFVQLAA